MTCTDSSSFLIASLSKFADGKESNNRHFAVMLKLAKKVCQSGNPRQRVLVGASDLSGPGSTSTNL